MVDLINWLQGADGQANIGSPKNNYGRAAAELRRLNKEIDDLANKMESYGNTMYSAKEISLFLKKIIKKS